MIWTICDDSGVEVETSVERFFAGYQTGYIGI
jgi:hypothetical protein